MGARTRKRPRASFVIGSVPSCCATMHASWDQCSMLVYRAMGGGRARAGTLRNCCERRTAHERAPSGCSKKRTPPGGCGKNRTPTRARMSRYGGSQVTSERMPGGCGSGSRTPSARILLLPGRSDRVVALSFEVLGGNLQLADDIDALRAHGLARAAGAAIGSATGYRLPRVQALRERAVFGHELEVEQA